MLRGLPAQIELAGDVVATRDAQAVGEGCAQQNRVDSGRVNRNGSLTGLRQELVDEFTARMVADGMDRFAAAGIVASWWDESFFDLKTASSRGWKSVINAWLTTAEAIWEDNNTKKNAQHLADQPVVKLLAASELARRAELVELAAESRSAKASRSAKTSLREIDASLLNTARDNLSAMKDSDVPAAAIGVLRNRVEKLMGDYFAELQRETDAWYTNLIDKYGKTLYEFETERDSATALLKEHLGRLGYG